MDRPVPPLRTALWRGIRRRCPRCGNGKIFHGWIRMREACSGCELPFEEKGGDTWGFWVFVDRIFLFGAIIALYFGFAPEGWLLRGLFLAIVVVPLVATMPHRQGAFIALDYLSRTHWR